MPDVLSLQTPHFALTVWTKDVAKPQAMLKKTHAARGEPLPQCKLIFGPALAVTTFTPQNMSAAQPLEELDLTEPIFFENKLYEFEFKFSSEVDQAEPPAIIHRLRGVEEGFHYKHGSLRGSVNFGNDIGWFRLGVRYQVGKREVIQYLSFQVLPTKMAMETDLAGIHRVMDEFYPLWRFSFAQKTEQELAKSRKPHERFELLWLAHFTKLRHDLQRGIEQILRAPHSRLLPYEQHIRAERLRGRLSPRLEERVTTDTRYGEGHHHYPVTRGRLLVDTPENRFIKMILSKSIKDITRFGERARLNDQPPDRERVSPSFFDELERWKKPLEQLLMRPFFDEVGPFDGMASESLVLHQRTGYSGVYRIWQELKLYLDLFGRNASISMKSVAALYEVWCLLAVRKMLLELGFTEKSNRKAVLNNVGMEKKVTAGIGAAFHLERSDGITIRLAHEPLFSKPENPSFGKVYSWTTVQKPDIFLEAAFANGETVQWIFDAKYRIENDDNSTDWAPDDAINQMHRYRDALIYVNKADDGEQQKSRPILGAFVLYPGWFDESMTLNPYTDAIEAVGIGGFPMLPSRPNKWMHDFLETRFGNANQPYKIPEPDQYFVEDSARISLTGTYLGRYSDLTLAASLGPTAGRNHQYVQGFLVGRAHWYHTRLDTTNKKSIARNTMREVRYCAIGVHHNGNDRIITHLYEVKSVQLVKRCDLTIEQAGKISLGNKEYYWLFELGYARPLIQPLIMPTRSFKLKLTNAADLLATTSWATLPEHYTLQT